MNRRSRVALPAIMMTSLILIGFGAMQWTEEVTGVVIRNWISPSTIVPAKAYKWTWGVGSVPQSEPDLWHFRVIFAANDTALISLLWDLNQSILFARNSSTINETFNAPLPRANQAWRWDWLIENPHTTALEVQNFTIIHYSITFPERENGSIMTSVGVSVLLAASVVVYLKKRGKSLR